MKSLRTRKSHTVIARATLLILGGMLTLTGCRTTKRATEGTRIDRLMNAYPPMATGRFVVIADFEDPAHMELVTFSTNSPDATFARRETGGRPETGPACLAVRVTGPNDTIVFSNRASSSWYLKRDWRDYDAFLMSVYVPDRGIDIDVTLQSGTGATTAAISTTQRLEPGWNALSFALAEAADHLAMDDVREIRLAFNGITEPTDVTIDDLILTADRTTVFGDPKNEKGQLYAEHVADRLVIGAGGSFELAFDNAQIVQWFDRKKDPHRLHNLVAGTALGPTPAYVRPPRDDENGVPLLFAGRVVLARQRLLEINKVRAVIECVWHFVDDPDDPISGRPMVRRVFTIYPTGQMFVAVAADAGDTPWPEQEIGLAVSMAKGADTGMSIGIGSTPSTSASSGAYAWAGSQDAGGDLLFVATADGTPLTIMDEPEAAHDIMRLIATGGAPLEHRRLWTAVLWLRVPPGDTSTFAAQVAAAYDTPPDLAVDLGTIDHEAGKAALDRATGVYRLRPDAGRVRLRLEPNEPYTFAAAFSILQTADLDAWIYVDDAIYDRSARDQAGNLIFQIDTPVPRPTTIEVLTRRRQTTSGS